MGSGMEIMMKKTFKTSELVIMAFFTAILCVSAYISIPIGIASITLLNFIILLIAFVFPLRDSLIIVILWMIMGACGIPVFIMGHSGVGYLLGVTGGYTWAFLVVTIYLGLVKGKQYSRLKYTIHAIIASILVDLVGMIWWMVLGKLTLKSAFLMGFVPFIPLDMVKSVVAAQICPVFTRLLPQD